MTNVVTLSNSVRPHTEGPCSLEMTMKRVLFFAFAAAVAHASSAVAAEGLIEVKSPYPVAETLNRMEAGAKQRGLKVFARIDHSAGAASVGKTLRPTELLIFGNPQGGTPLMECAQSIGIELPLKALAWQDEQGQVWIGYNDPGYIAKRHRVESCAAAGPIAKALASLVAEAVAR